MNLLPDRAHHQQRNDQRDADQHLVRRALLQADGLAQDGQHDDEAREAGHHHQHRRQEAEQGHDDEDLQLHREFLAVLGIVQIEQSDLATGGLRGQRQQPEQQQAEQAQAATQIHGAKVSRLVPDSSTMRRP
ncbi:hypothetical protein D3C77_541540 [compost metagenome]